MAQIYSQSKAYRDMSLPIICKMSEEEAHEKFVDIKWGGRDTVVCPFCRNVGKQYYVATRRIWKCKECDEFFSVTTGTILQNRKLSFLMILIAAFLFIAAPKSDAANRVHSMLGVTLRTIYVLFGKFREALWEQRDKTPLSGVVHIDGGHFCGKPRRPRVRQKATSTIVNSKLRNRKASIIPNEKGYGIEPWNKDKLENRRIVLVMREVIKDVGGTKTRVVIVPAETRQYVTQAIRTYVSVDATVMTDFSHAYSNLGSWYDHHRVNHSEEYAKADGTNQNQAESFIARMRRSEFGVLHGMRHMYLALYANEFAWREDMRFYSLGQKLTALLSMIMQSGPSKVWLGYNQGHRLNVEYDGIPKPDEWPWE